MKTEITLHGQLGKAVGERWSLAIKNVGEAIHAIEILSGHKLYPFLRQSDKQGLAYKIIVNGKTFKAERPLSVTELDTIKHSELCINQPNIETIDIVPLLQGADSDILTIVLAAIIIIIGVIVTIIFYGAGVPIIMVGLGLLAAGVTNLLSSPPKFEDFREIKGSAGQASYLFNGPENTVNEGGPVPVGYGRLLVGSQVVSASYEISHTNAEDNPLTV